jgi:hypothetical protein
VELCLRRGGALLRFAFFLRLVSARLGRLIENKIDALDAGAGLFHQKLGGPRCRQNGAGPRKLSFLRSRGIETKQRKRRGENHCPNRVAQRGTSPHRRSQLRRDKMSGLKLPTK